MTDTNEPERRQSTAPVGLLTLRAVRPALVVLTLWGVLAIGVYWSVPQSTPWDAFALAYNQQPVIGLLLGLALIVGAANLLLSTNAEARTLVAKALYPLGAPWRHMPRYVQHQWITLTRIAIFVGVALLILSVLRSGTAWQMLNAGISEFPLHLPQYVIGGAIQLVIFVSSFLLLFVVLSRGGVTTMLPEEIKTSLDQVWGQDQVVNRMRETIMFLREPDRIEKAGGHVPSGILLWGPPGTGKTLIAEAIAGETTVPFVLVEPGAFQNMFVGIGVLRVKALYRKLRKLSEVYGGVVVFFDEADVLGSRGGRAQDTPMQHAAMGRLVNKAVMPMVGGGDLGTLNAILAAMQGVKTPRGLGAKIRRAFGFPAPTPTRHRILHIMATNMPGSLDPALLRPGRIDRMFRVGYPSKEGRAATLKGYLDKVAHSISDEQIEDIAAITPGATGATIKDMVNEAVIDALRDGRSEITYQDLLNAKRFKEFGPPEGVEYIPFERHAVAIHEASHAVMAWKLRKHLTIDTVTIEKGQTYLGMVSSVPNEDSYTRWKSEYVIDIKVALAGAAGEQVFFGDTTSGVAGDLEAATGLARAMLGRWGMGDTLAVPDASSERVQDELSRNVELLLQSLMDETRNEILSERSRVLCLAHALEIQRTLTGKDVEAILEFRPGLEVDGARYDSKSVQDELETYHERMLQSRHSALIEAPNAEDVVQVSSTPHVTQEWPSPRDDDES